MSKKALVTGASGFIGSALVERLEQEDIQLCYAVRGQGKTLNPVVYRGEISPNTDWLPVLKGVDVVIHLAARAHVLRDSAESPEDEFMRVNFEAVTNLARHCVESGVSKFIFLSSIGVSVNNFSREPVDEETQCENIEGYAKSKLLAEQKLKEICTVANMDLVIIRPPLVYGENAPGNFGRLLKLAASPIPLPFGLANNKRNFVSRANLVDFITHCVLYQSPINDVFVVSDDEVVSTKDLITYLREGMGRTPRLVPISPSIFGLLAGLVRKPKFHEQLFCDLQVSNTKARNLLRWSPPFKAPDELRKCGTKIKNK